VADGQAESAARSDGAAAMPVITDGLLAGDLAASVVNANAGFTAGDGRQTSESHTFTVTSDLRGLAVGTGSGEAGRAITDDFGTRSLMAHPGGAWNSLAVGTLDKVRQDVALDQFFVELGQNAAPDNGLPERMLPVESPERSLPSQDADPVPATPAPAAVPDSADEDGFSGLLTAALAEDEPGMAMWHQACDACFANEAWTPPSETTVAGSVFAVALAANPVVLRDLLRIRTARRQQRDTIPALPRHGVKVSD
jgi:hypothetical protein